MDRATTGTLEIFEGKEILPTGVTVIFLVLRSLIMRQIFEISLLGWLFRADDSSHSEIKYLIYRSILLTTKFALLVSRCRLADLALSRHLDSFDRLLRWRRWNKDNIITNSKHIEKKSLIRRSSPCESNLNRACT